MQNPGLACTCACARTRLLRVSRLATIPSCLNAWLQVSNATFKHLKKLNPSGPDNTPCHLHQMVAEEITVTFTLVFTMLLNTSQDTRFWKQTLVQPIFRQMTVPSYKLPFLKLNYCGDLGKTQDWTRASLICDQSHHSK